MTDECEQTSATWLPSTMPSPPSTQPNGSRERRSYAFVREDLGRASGSALPVDHRRPPRRRRAAKFFTPKKTTRGSQPTDGRIAHRVAACDFHERLVALLAPREHLTMLMGRQLARRRWRHRPHQAARTNHLYVLAERLFIARRSRRGGNFGLRIADASRDVAKGQRARLAIRALFGPT